MAALDILKYHNVDIVLMDIEMPTMDGIPATQKIHEGEAGQDKMNIPIVAMSAHALTEYREKAMDYGMNEYITKPINIIELQNCISIVQRKTDKTRNYPS